MQRLRNLWTRFWQEETAFVISSEMVLMSAVTVTGLLVGMQSVRDSVLSEFDDVSQAMTQLDQSYSVSGVASRNASTAGSVFVDSPGDAYRSPGLVPTKNDAPKGALNKFVVWNSNGEVIDIE